MAMTPLSSPQTVASSTVPGSEAAALRKKTPAKWLLAGSALFVVLMAWALFFRRSDGQSTPVTTGKAMIKTITQLVTATGKIYPEIEVKISPDSVFGEIVALPFRNGDSVKKGTTHRCCS